MVADSESIFNDFSYGVSALHIVQGAGLLTCVELPALSGDWNGQCR